MRKDETSWAEDGSKGVGWKGPAGSWRRVDEDDEDDEEEVEEVDLRPVRESQIDMLMRRLCGECPHDSIAPCQK